METLTNFFRWYFIVIFTNQICSSLTPSVNIDRNMSSVYTKEIPIKIEGTKNQTVRRRISLTDNILITYIFNEFIVIYKYI